MFSSTVGRVIIGLAIILVAGLQFAFWFGESGYHQHQKLLTDITTQQDANQELYERNRILAAEVYDLKNGAEAIEEHARLDLGLIKSHETFIQMSMITGTYDPIYLNNNSADTLNNETPAITP